MDLPVVVGVGTHLVCRIGNVNSASTRRGFVLTWMMACWEGGIVDFPIINNIKKAVRERGSEGACVHVWACRNIISSSTKQFIIMLMRLFYGLHLLFS